MVSSEHLSASENYMVSSEHLLSSSGVWRHYLGQRL